MENKPFDFNIAQLNGILVPTSRVVKVWGRGTGKSTDTAWKINQVNEHLPRFTNAISGETFQQLLTKTLPTAMEGLERLGIYKDVDYFIGRKPDPKFSFDSPYAPIGSYEHLITFKNGTTWVLSSQDRLGANRGMNLGFVLGDEMLTQDKKKFQDELIAGLRGNAKRVKKNNPYLHGWHLSTSMPTSEKARWIIDFANYYSEEDQPIWQTWNKMCQLQLKLIRSEKIEELDELIKQIKDLRKSIQFFPSKKTGILFSLANAFDNIRNLGWSYLKGQYQALSEYSFRTEILNEFIQMEEKSFYKIDEEKHLYTHFDYGHLDGLNYDIEKLKDIDSRQDADVDKSRELDLSIDFGANMNGIRVAQEHSYDFKGRPSYEYRYAKSIYVKYPEGLKEVAAKFMHYYRHHHKKRVNLPYDHTAVGRDPVRDQFIVEFIRELRNGGWEVNDIYIGQTLSHHNRYLLWDILLKGNDPRVPKILFNRSNDWDGILSMMLAGVRIGRKGGFEKDKRSERSSKIPDEQATHLSDAGDTLVVWRYWSKLQEVAHGFDLLM